MRDKQERIVNWKSFFFYIFWIMLLVGKGMGYDSRSSTFRLMTWIAISFAIVKLLLTRWRKKELLICFSLSLLGILVWYFSKDTAVLLSIVTLISLKDIDILQLFKVSFWIKGPMFVLRTSISILGFIDKQMMYRYSNGVIIAKRYGLGYGQPNATHYTLFVIIALCIITYHERLKLAHYFLMMLYNAYIYTYTNSKTGLGITCFLIVASYLASNKKYLYIHKLVSKIINNAYIIGAILSFLICYLVAKMEYLSNLGTLSSRFLTATKVINNYSINLFGSPGVITDFGYVNILYGNGIIVWFAFIIGNTLLLKKLESYHLQIERIILLCYAVYTLSEAYSISVLMNFSIVMLASIVFSRTNLRKSKIQNGE